MATAVRSRPQVSPRPPALPPGPRVPRPVQAALWGLRYAGFTRWSRERFGATYTVRPGTFPPSVVTTERDAIKRLLTGDPLAKRHGNDVLRPLIGYRSVLLLEPREHLERRKLLLPPFHGDRIRTYAAVMQRLLDEELERWRPGETITVWPVAQRITMDVILDAVLGLREEEMRTRLRRLIDDTVEFPVPQLRRLLRLGERPARPRMPRVLSELMQLPSPAVMTYFPETKVRSAWKNPGTIPWWRAMDELMALLAEHVRATRADPRLAERDDILAMLVQARPEDEPCGADGGERPLRGGAGLSDEDLREELVTLITAGHETTAGAIAWGIELLAHDPGARSRAKAAAEAGDDAYVGSLVKEVLRLRPPVPIAAARRLAEPFPIGPHLIPPDTYILVDAIGVHHDPQLHSEPERLRPERFLDRSPEPYTWLPFGGGAHRCVGAALAELEMKLAFSAILARTDFVSADARPAPYWRRGITYVPRGGARIRLTAVR